MDEKEQAQNREVAEYIDRLVTVGVRRGRKMIIELYEAASKAAGGKPVSLAAAEKLIERVKKNDRVILIDQFAYRPVMPHGEADGPPGVASLAHALRFGLGAFPVICTGPNDMEPARASVQAAGINVLEYDTAVQYSLATGGMITFPILDEKESKVFAASVIDKCKPKAILSVETLAPNKKGVKHSGSGFNVEAQDKLPHVEQLFLEANARGILTIGCCDRGNEMGSGTIEETVRKIVPFADVCQCPCKGGAACAVKADVIFPAQISNWGAYAISAMIAYMTKNPKALQDEDTERRVLEACAMAGGIDGQYVATSVSADGIGLKGQQGLLNLMHNIIENCIKGMAGG